MNNLQVSAFSGLSLFMSIHSRGRAIGVEASEEQAVSTAGPLGVKELKHTRDEFELEELESVELELVELKLFQSEALLEVAFIEVAFIEVSFMSLALNVTLSRPKIAERLVGRLA